MEEDGDDDEVVDEREIKLYSQGCEVSCLHTYYTRPYSKYNCDQVCENQPGPHKLHLVGCSSISSVLKKIISFCKL